MTQPNESLTTRLESSTLEKAKPKSITLTRQDIQQIGMTGNLVALPPEAKWAYYVWNCNQIGISPLNMPFYFLRQTTKEGTTEKLCPLKSLAHWLRKKNHVSERFLDDNTIQAMNGDTNNCFVKIRLSLPDGRQGEDIGMIDLTGYSGQFRANKIKTCVTQAKNRATWSLFGLGYTDESEVPDIKNAVLANAHSEIPDNVMEAEVIIIEPPRAEDAEILKEE